MATQRRAKPKDVKKLKKAVKSKSAKKKKDTTKNYLTNPFFQAGTPEHRSVNIGNDFYKLRSRHGRERLFSDPQAMLEAFDEYREAKRANPWYKLEKLGKKFEPVPTIMPLTWDSFCIFCHVAPSYFLNFKKKLFSEDEDRSFKMPESTRHDFARVLEIIDRLIRDQKYNGAAAGYFKENLISFDLGIRKDEPQMEISGSGVSIIVKDEEDKELLESLRKKLKE